MRAPTRTLNPTVPQEFVDRAIAKDPASAAAEYMAEFRDDIGGWLTLDMIENAVDRGVTVRPPHRAHDYRAFADPSGGRGDSFTLAIAHDWQGMAVLDCLVEVAPPFYPISAVAQIAATLREYGLSEVTGDQIRSGMGQCRPLRAAASRTARLIATARAIYSDALPLFTSGRARILDVPSSSASSPRLERKTQLHGSRPDRPRTGRPRRLCNSAAGALVAASSPDRRPRLIFG